jgi:hypothetical protein
MVARPARARQASGPFYLVDSGTEAVLAVKESASPPRDRRATSPASVMASQSRYGCWIGRSGRARASRTPEVSLSPRSTTADGRPVEGIPL